MWLVAVKDNSPVLVYNRNAKAFHAVPRYIVAKQTDACEAVLAQRLYHLVVVHLQSRVKDVNLVLLLALILIYTEADGEEQENTANAEQ